MIDFKLFGVLISEGQTDRQTDVDNCTVAFVTENYEF